ncbi:P-loop containing nucleoside triphosphate hydrolase protein [Cokeromyces recurvatus]|uniref:P-loop containing nucleoside triphosphate hydrolase protein n=1 Tax=Cokeromyces recurvatus TaxID=90255 RepID=UPI00221EEE5D|nr:P-loop containing nucleoside triphosphate hydrolase protein [Cokeromyces recurvatus]KAI7906043.1 P-loop containing nucleoside triphosphate hydrolase protein [Cokeromyces recurvatus]
MPATAAAQKNTKSDIQSKKMNVVVHQADSKVAKEIVAKLSSDADRESAAEELAAFVQSNGVLSLVKCNITTALAKEFGNKKNAGARQGAVAAFAALTNNSLEGQVEPFILPFLSNLLELQADKQVAVKNAALEAAKNFIAKMNPYACPLTIPSILEGLGNSCKWQTKMLALELLVNMTELHPKEFFVAIPDVIPVVSDCMWDTKTDVKKQATETMAAICKLIENKDIERFIPAVITCINHPENVPETIHLLGATTFVQEVDSATLSIMVPLLNRGLNERATPIKRKSALIIDNMSKLVDDPDVAAPFLPLLLPALEKVQDVVADPECRGVVQKALATLQRVGNPATEVFTKVQKQEKVEKSIKELLPTDLDAAFTPTVKYMNDVALNLCVAKNFFKNVWVASLAPYAKSFYVAADAENLAFAALNKCEEAVTPKDPEEEDDEGEDLCNCEFSLAYGAKILLNRTALRLKRGRRYGLCGANGCGKSTLMRAIANEQVEGFPPRSELKTVYVEHDIDGSEADTPLVDFILASDGVETKDREEVRKILLDYGFTEQMVTKMAIGELSGGWKMKLALARAMLMNADILLLDEPTNHLDVVNVAWLENYLLGLKTVTSIIVSHDSGFLDHVCSDIIHYEPNYKLKRYKGNLSEFVKKVPRAASYYSLEATQISFKFPEPGFLEGIKTKERAILKMKNVDFQYPGTDRKQLIDISMQCSLASRVAVIGPNGAGKSTLIKLLTGEIESEIGTVWKHPNLRIAYVAQHAFHHIEKHLDSTPNEYIQWRYATGEDREELDKNDRMNADTNKKLAEQVFIIDGEKRIVEALVGRRKLKQSYEYEVSWVGRSSVDNTWISRQKLEDMGFGKKIAEVDSAEAAKMGLNRPLTSKEIEKHLAEIGLEPEFATHSRIRGLSGGQKVKLVIGAAMWNKPHMLVLDEPTNYLDRESLGALAQAIKEYGGGVVIVTHNREFSEALCTEVWKVDNGRLTPSGHNWVSGNGTTVIKEQEAEDMVDAQGNTVKAVEKKKKLTSKELRKKKKERMERRKRGEEVYTTDEEL